MRPLVALLTVVALTGCSAEPSVTSPEGPSSTAPSPPDPSPTDSATTDSATTDAPTPAGELVLVVHRSSPLRSLAAGQVEAIREGRTRWRVVGGVRQVSRDPRAVAFVALDEVRPWVRTVPVDGVDPLAGTTSIRVVGDIMLDRGVAAASPEDDPVWALRPVRRLLEGADLTVGNLEMALSEDGTPQQPGDDSFAARPAVLEGLADLGLDAVSLANNHTGDYGTPALLDTVAAVRRSPVAGFGAGPHLDAAGRAAYLDAGGLRVALLGFNAIGETPTAGPRAPGALSLTMPPRTGPLDGRQLATVLDAVRRADERADVVLVVPHWGGNYTHVADPAQTLVARRLAAAGADLVVGGHPHWVQGLERVGDAVVAHSLGNLVFDMDFSPPAMEGVALTARFAGDTLVSVDLTPYALDASFRPHVLRGSRATALLDTVRAHSTGPFR